jgi:hypothetical protein
LICKVDIGGFDAVYRIHRVRGRVKLLLSSPAFDDHDHLWQTTFVTLGGLSQCEIVAESIN